MSAHTMATRYPRSAIQAQVYETVDNSLVNNAKLINIEKQFVSINTFEFDFTRKLLFMDRL